MSAAGSGRSAAAGTPRSGSSWCSWCWDSSFRSGAPQPDRMAVPVACRLFRALGVRDVLQHPRLRPRSRDPSDRLGRAPPRGVLGAHDRALQRGGAPVPGRPSELAGDRRLTGGPPPGSHCLARRSIRYRHLGDPYPQDPHRLEWRSLRHRPRSGLLSVVVFGGPTRVLPHARRGVGRMVGPAGADLPALFG